MRHRRPGRGDSPSRGRLRAAGGPDPGAGDRCAPPAGAELYRNTTVTGISRTAAGEWCVRTDTGDIVCEHVVSATGNFARRTGAMVGLDVPVIPVQHQYIVTEPHPEIAARHAAGLPEMGGAARVRRLMVPARGAGRADPRTLRDRRARVLRRRPRRGLRVRAVPGGTLERLEPHIEAAINRVPAFGEVGVRQVFNGAICYNPPGREPDHRSRLGHRQLLAQRRAQLRHHRGRRRGIPARGVDGGGRADHRHDGGRPPALRRLRDQGVPREEERGGVRQRLHHPLSRRGTSGRPGRCAPRPATTG